IPQVPAGDNKRIDLVVVGAHTRLGVECDGSRWHNMPEQVRSDIHRERELRRAGWQFWQLREGDFLLDPDRALEPRWAGLPHGGTQPHHAQCHVEERDRGSMLWLGWLTAVAGCSTDSDGGGRAWVWPGCRSGHAAGSTGGGWEGSAWAGWGRERG